MTKPIEIAEKLERQGECAPSCADGSICYEWNGELFLEAAQLIRELVERERWIVVNIGCIECGVSSNIVGVFDDESRARDIAAKFDQSFNWREGGQNAFDVFQMPPLNEIAVEYLPSPPEEGEA